MSVRIRVWTAALGLVALLLSAQVGASLSAPSSGGGGVERAIGQAGFAYLGGLRTFAAAVLWNRLEPVFHGYYEDVPVSEQAFVLPSIYLVEALDPQFEQGYYLGAYALAAREDFDAALSLARRGVEINPRSGLLRANYIQILIMQDKEKNRALIESQAVIGLGRKMTWSSPEDLYEGLAIFRSVYRQKGDELTAAKIQTAMDQISSQVDVGDHDHNGDGAQDH